MDGRGGFVGTGLRACPPFRDCPDCDHPAKGQARRPVPTANNSMLGIPSLLGGTFSTPPYGAGANARFMNFSLSRARRGGNPPRKNSRKFRLQETGTSAIHHTGVSGEIAVAGAGCVGCVLFSESRINDLPRPDRVNAVAPRSPKTCRRCEPGGAERRRHVSSSLPAARGLKVLIRFQSQAFLERREFHDQAPQRHSREHV